MKQTEGFCFAGSALSGDGGREWWHDTIAYQIYPKSFKDTNNDGIGDIRGIISKLNYLKELGINLIWLSPAYPSPLADEGYDISDYYGVDPRFGSLEDMDELIAECGRRGIKLILDLVVNHCSDEHAWFQDVLRNPETSPYRDYFYIVDKPADGSLPTNWRSFFGGSVWEPLGTSDQLYLHSFHKKQPDLNWENPKVREEVKKNIEWWLKRGIAGFRIDAIINIKKALPFKDYPVDGSDGLCELSNMLAEADGIGTFLTELREEVFKPHNAFTVGEVFQVGEERLPEWIGAEGYFSSMFDFNGHIFGGSDWRLKPRISAEDYKECVFEAQQAAGSACYLSNIIENHDEPRGVSYYLPEGEVNDVSKKMLAGLYFMLRGIPFIYQGQELGMENMPFESIDEILDISSIDQYQRAREAGLSDQEALNVVKFFSRDNARTPMQWDDSKNAGFTEGKPWLAVNPNYKSINVKAQCSNPNSILGFYKQLIALRKDEELKNTLVEGVTVPYLQEQKNLFAYQRVGEKCLCIAGNFQREVQDMKVPAGMNKVLLSNYEGVTMSGDMIRLEGYQFVVLV